MSLDFSQVYFYAHPSLPDLERVVREVAEVFPSCKVEINEPVYVPEQALQYAKISDTKQPFERQPPLHERKDFSLYGRQVPLYDGHVLQRLIEQAIGSNAAAGHAYIVFTNLLACTFSEDDWRYHARTVICGTPAVVSTAGIVEAPAKPREFYVQAAYDLEGARRKIASRFIDYGDPRMAGAAAGCALQALFYFLTGGEPFCDDDSCRLYNAHWQHDLLRTQVERPTLCLKHKSLANKFNRRQSMRKSK